MRLKKRNGIVGLLAGGPIMLAIILIVIGVVITISQVLTQTGGQLSVDLLTDMPTFYNYDNADGTFQFTNFEKTDRIQVYEVILWAFIGMIVLVNIVNVLHKPCLLN